MVAAVRQSRPIANYTSTYAGSLADSFASLPLVGSVVAVIAEVYNGATTIFACSDNQGNSYVTTAKNTGDTNLMVAYCVVATSGGTFTVTVTNDGYRSASLQLVEMTGIDTTTPLGAYNFATSAQASATTTVSGQLAIAFSAINGGGGTFPEASGNYTLLDSVNGANWDAYHYYKVCGAAGTEVTNFTNSVTGKQGIVTFMPAAGGGSPTSYYLSDMIEM